MQKHKELTKAGYHQAARLILRGFIFNGGVIPVPDYHDEAYQSGLAKWLMDNFRCHRNRHSFTAILN